MKVDIDYTWEPEVLQHSYRFRVTGDYDPGEPMVWRYPDGSGHPGVPPSIENIEVCLVEVTGEEGTHSGLSEPYREELEQTFEYQIQNNPDLFDAVVSRLLDQAKRNQEDRCV